MLEIHTDLIGVLCGLVLDRRKESVVQKTGVVVILAVSPLRQPITLAQV